MPHTRYAFRLPRWLRFALAALGLTLLMVLEDLFVDGDSWAQALREFPFTLGVMFVGLVLGTSVLGAIIARSPAQCTITQWTVELGAVVLYATVLGAFFGGTLRALGFINEPDPSLLVPMGRGALISIIINLSLWGILRYVRLQQERDALRLLSARLEKESADLQYKALKSQVNPHFLFNSLNVLASLVHQDPALAEAYIREFARIFRYVLELNDEPVVTVRQELAFLNSYVFMQQIRFGASLQVAIRVPAEALERLLPPLSLQLLAENALKHNVVSKAAPLALHLTGTTAYLELANTYQPRAPAADSTGVGLRNLREKYRLLTGAEPEFGVRDAHYVARLPLIQPE